MQFKLHTVTLSLVTIQFWFGLWLLVDSHLEWVDRWIDLKPIAFLLKHETPKTDMTWYKPLSVTSASMTASIGGAWIALDRNSPMEPRRRSLMERATSWRGVRNISGVMCSSSFLNRSCANTQYLWKHNWYMIELLQQHSNYTKFSIINSYASSVSQNSLYCIDGSIFLHELALLDPFFVPGWCVMPKL